jgi:hypothetical protein
MILALLECLAIWFMVSIPSSLIIGALLSRRNEQPNLRRAKSPVRDPVASKPAPTASPPAAVQGGYETAN